jgi:molecular chaperone DnaJ
MPQPTHYEVLGLAQDAPQEEVKRAFRRMAMARHPDLNPADPQAARLFRKVVEAYEVLGDERARCAYDASLHRERNRGRRFRESMETVVSPEARAEVRISHSQAARGVRLAVDIPVDRPCPDCGGAGRGRPCRRCGGTGRIGEEAACMLDIPPGAMDGDVHLLMGGPLLVEVVVRVV